MMAVGADECRAVLARGSVREADPHLGLGRELAFVDGPARTIVVYFGAGDAERYRSEVTDRILALDDSWLLVPRHATVASLGIVAADPDAAALRFADSERASLGRALMTEGDLAAIGAIREALQAAESAADAAAAAADAAHP